MKYLFKNFNKQKRKKKMSDFLGKSVSINCGQVLGVFQGIIKFVSPQRVTIIRAFRNGIPLKKQDMEISFE